jgi:hypothetical protein
MTTFCQMTPNTTTLTLMTLGIATFSKMAVSVTTVGKMTLGIIPLSLMILINTLKNAALDITFCFAI